ncbi:MAG: flavodoxin family protein [Methanomassiliicoccales archaeon]
MNLVVGILGSPRRGGNCDVLLDECLDGAFQSGAKTQKISLCDLHITPCQGCNSCLETGECVLRDDMTLIYKILQEANAILIASPIYFSGPSCIVKCMMDRCQCLWARERLLNRKVEGVRYGGLILVGGDHKAVFRNAQSEIRAFFSGIGITFQGELLVAGVEKKGEVRSRPDYLLSARRLGQNMTFNLSRIG